MSAAMLAEVVKAKSQPIHLVEVRFDAGDGGVAYMTDAYRAITWGGNSYLAVGHFLGFDGIEETAEVKTSVVKVSLSGVDQTWIARMLSRQYLGRTLVIYKGFLDTSTDALLVDPVAIVQGPMDAPEIDEDPSGGTCIVTVGVTSLGADFDSPTGRHTNLVEQQVYFPADTAFKLCAQVSGQLAGRQVYWGVPNPPGFVAT
jgi:hypothetical protein